MAGEGAAGDGTRLNSVNLLSMILTEGSSPPLDLLEQLLLDESSPSVRELELQRQYEAAQELIANLKRQLESANDAAAQLQTKHSLLRRSFVTLHRVAARSLAERDATIRDLNKRLNDLEQSAASCRHGPVSSADVLVNSTATPSDEAIGTHPPSLVSQNAPASDVSSASRVSHLSENYKSPAVKSSHLDRELSTDSRSSVQQAGDNNASLQTTAQKEVVVADPLRPVPAAAAAAAASGDVIPMDFSDTLGPCNTSIVNQSSSQLVATSAKNIKITVSEQKSCSSSDSMSLPDGAVLLSLISLLPCQSPTVKQSSADPRDVVGTLDPKITRRAETKLPENANLTFAKVSAVKDRRMKKGGIRTVTRVGISLEKKGTESELELTCSSRDSLSGQPKSTTNHKTFPTQDHNSGKKWTDPATKTENVVQVGVPKVGNNSDGELNKTSEKSTPNVESEADLRRTCSTEKGESTLPSSKKRSRESDRFNGADVNTENSGKLPVKRPKADDTVTGTSTNVKIPVGKVVPSKLTAESSPSPQTPGLTDSERLLCYKALSKERETEQRISFRESERHRRQTIPDVKVSTVDKMDDVGPPSTDVEPARKPDRSKSGTDSMMPSTPSIFTVRTQQKITKLRQERELEKAEPAAAAIMDVDKSVTDDCSPDRCENNIELASVTALCSSMMPVAAQTVNATDALSIASENKTEDHFVAPKSIPTNDAVSSLSVGVAGFSESSDVVDGKSPAATLPAVDKVKRSAAQKLSDRRSSSDSNKTSKDAAQKSGSVAVSRSSSKSEVKVGASETRRRESRDREGTRSESRAAVIETLSCEEKNQKKTNPCSLPESRDVAPPDVAVTTSLSRSSNDLKKTTSNEVESNLRTENTDKLPDVVCPKDVKLLNTGAAVAVDDRKRDSRRSSRDTSRSKSTKTSSDVSDKVKSVNVQHSDPRSSSKREEISAEKCSVISGRCGEHSEGKEQVEKAEECENRSTEKRGSVAESGQRSHRSSSERNTESKKKAKDKDRVSARMCSTDGSERIAVLHVAGKIPGVGDTNVSTRMSNTADGQKQSVSSNNVSDDHSLSVVQDSSVNSASCATSAPSSEAKLTHSGVVSPRNFSKQSFISPNRDNAGTDVFGIAARQTRIKEASQNKSPVSEVQRAGVTEVQLSPTFKSLNELHSATKTLDNSTENSFLNKRLQLSSKDVSADHDSVAGRTGDLHVPDSPVSSILPAADGSGKVTPCRQPGIIRTNRPSLNISDSCVDFVSNPENLPGSPNISYLSGKTPVDTFSSGEDLFEFAIAGRTPAQLPSDDATNDGCDSIMSPLFNDCNAIDGYYGDIESGIIDKDSGNVSHVTGDFIAASSDNQHVSFDSSFTGSGLPCTCDHSDTECCSSCSTCLNANSQAPPDTVHNDDRQQSPDAGENVTENEVGVDAANVNPNSPHCVKSPAEPFRIFRQSSDRDKETIDSSIQQQQQPVDDAAVDDSRSDFDSDNEEDKCNKMDLGDDDISPCRTIRIEGEGIIFECTPDSEAEDSNSAACSPLSTPEKKCPASGLTSAGVTMQSTRGNSREQQPVLLLAEDCNSVYRLFGEVSESESEQSDASPASQKRKDNLRNIAKSNPTEQTTSIRLEVPKPDVEDGEITDSDVEPIRRNAASCSYKTGDKENMKETPKKRRPIGSTSDRTLVRRSSNERRSQGQKDSPVEGSRRGLTNRQFSSDDVRRRDSHRSSREVGKHSKSRSPLRSSGTTHRRSPLLSGRVRGVSRAVNGRSENRFGQSSRRWASIGFGKRRRN